MDKAASLKNGDTPSWLTKDFLANVLRNGKKDASIIVEDLEVQPVVGKGDNYASVLHKVLINFHDSGGITKRTSLIIKTLPNNDVMQRWIKEAHLFDKELYAYNSLIPAMRELAESPLASARYFPTERPFTVILEDITARGFKMADRRKGLDLPHCLLALKTLAKFHSFSSEFVRRDPSIVKNFPESVHTESTREMNMRYIPTIYSSLADIVETWPGFERFGEKIRSRKESIIEELEKVVEPDNNSFNVVNHGDFWVNNMMFRYSAGTQEVEEVCMIDFQILRFGSPALDLHYFLATSPADNIREEHEELLLETYHQALVETNATVCSNQGSHSLDQLKKDFDAKKSYGFHVGCTVLSAVVAEPSEALDMDSLTEESLESGESNLMEKAFQGKRFKDTLQKLLLYYEKKGAI